MSQLVRLEGKHTTQTAHCALVRTAPDKMTFALADIDVYADVDILLLSILFLTMFWITFLLFLFLMKLMLMLNNGKKAGWT